MTSLRECAWCHVRQFIKARRLCVSCYKLAAKRGELDRWPLVRGAA